MLASGSRKPRPCSTGSPRPFKSERFKQHPELIVPAQTPDRCEIRNRSSPSPFNGKIFPRHRELAFVYSAGGQSLRWLLGGFFICDPDRHCARDRGLHRRRRVGHPPDCSRLASTAISKSDVYEHLTAHPGLVRGSNFSSKLYRAQSKSNNTTSLCRFDRTGASHHRRA